MKDYYDSLYSKIKYLLNDVTPLSADCGEICNKACCKGDDNTGMLLFPNEKSNLEVKENSNGRFAICDGKCNRADRPLSCMIFPFFPVLDENDKIKVSIDYRGYSVCPLIKNASVVKFNHLFLRRLKVAGNILIKDEKCKEFIKNISKEIEESKNLIEILNCEDK